MIWLARAIIFSDIVLSTIYIATYKVTFARAIGTILIVFGLIFGFGGSSISRTSRSVLSWALALVGYKFLLDISLHYTGGYEAVNQLLKELVVIRAYASLLDESNASLLREVMDRAEGPVTKKVDLNPDGKVIRVSIGNDG